MYMYMHRCGGVCKLYGYQVEYGGVGEPPPDMKHVGQCSQMATFTLPTDVPLCVTAPDTPSSYTMVTALCRTMVLTSA